jgi:hypothetical protein
MMISACDMLLSTSIKFWLSTLLMLVGLTPVNMSSSLVSFERSDRAMKVILLPLYIEEKREA